MTVDVKVGLPASLEWYDPVAAACEATKVAEPQEFLSEGHAVVAQVDENAVESNGAKHENDALLIPCCDDQWDPSALVEDSVEAVEEKTAMEEPETTAWQEQHPAAGTLPELQTPNS